jgi:hypothetical protein
MGMSTLLAARPHTPASLGRYAVGSMRTLAASLLCVLACSCTLGASASEDGGASDAAAADAGGADSGPGLDAGGGDGGSSDGGIVDAGGQDSGRDLSTDRNRFFGASRCADAGFQLCEDFESGTLNTALWTVTNASAVSVSTGDHARGSHALHISLTGNGAAYIKESRTFPEPGNTYYGRMFVKFIQMPARPMTYAHFTVMGASGSVVAGEIRISGQLPTNTSAPTLFGVGTDNRVQDAGTGDWTTSDNDPPGAPRAIPLNQWICLEWLHQGSTNETRFYWDATEHPSLHTTPAIHGGNSNPFILPQFQQVWVGWQEYQASTEPFEMWLDEVAIDPARIGCVD